MWLLYRVVGGIGCAGGVGCALASFSDLASLIILSFVFAVAIIVIVRGVELASMYLVPYMYVVVSPF